MLLAVFGFANRVFSVDYKLSNNLLIDNQYYSELFAVYVIGRLIARLGIIKDADGLMRNKGDGESEMFGRFRLTLIGYGKNQSEMRIDDFVIGLALGRPQRLIHQWRFFLNFPTAVY